MAMGTATAVTLLAIPLQDKRPTIDRLTQRKTHRNNGKTMTHLAMKDQPSSFITFWKVFVKDKSVLNILQQRQHHTVSKDESTDSESELHGETYSLRMTSKGFVKAAPATPAATDLMAERVKTAALF